MEKISSLRFTFIDALRGIAAFAVLFHHMLHNSVMEVTLRHILPLPLQVFSDYGANGVQVFFVLSGFVIAHSLRNFDGKAATITNFILRRQLRLDPALWTVLAFTLCLDRLRLAIPSLHAEVMPTIGDVFRNLFYLQNILHAKQVVGVAWTLCIEVQFYIVFVALLSLGKLQIPRKRASSVNASTLSVTLVFCLGISAILYSFFLSSQGAYFIAYWHYFAAGVLCYYGIQQRVPQWVFLSFMSVFLVATIIHTTPPPIIGIVTALCIYAVGRTGHLTDWLNNKPLQYLGRISYSLYLIHLVVAVSVLQFGYKITHQNQPMCIFWFVLAGILSIAAAHLLYTFVEKPSLKWSESFKRQSVAFGYSSQSKPATLQPVGIEWP